MSAIVGKLVERRIRHPYPRYCLRLYPFGMKDELANNKELKVFMLINKDIFVRVFSNDQLKDREYDCIFIDIDDSDLRNAFTKLHVVLEKLHNVGITNYLIDFSGSKGFHIFVWMEPVKLYQFKRTVVTWLTKIGIKDFVDSSTLEPRKVMRLPASINTKSDLHCITLGNELQYTYSQIISRSANNQLQDFDVIPNEGLAKTLLRIDGKLTGDKIPAVEKTIQNNIPTGVSQMFTDITCYPPCIRRLVALALDGVDLNHEERLAMGKFLLHVYGGDVDRVASYYSRMSDYNYNITSYQLQYINDNLVHMMLCDTLDSEGICCEAVNVCPFYPNLNKFIKLDNRLKKHNT